jgi:hypothetical protein
LDAARSGPTAAFDSPMMTDSPLTSGARVVLVVTVGVVPTVLMDGIVTNVELTPGDQPGAATLTVTGEDVSVLLDREERDAEYPAQDDHLQVLAAAYAAHPERFVRRPPAPKPLPTAVWINPPQPTQEATQ